MSITVDGTVTSKGQVTIPKEIRERLGLEAGQEVEFVLGDDGTVEVRPKKPALERLAEVRETIAAQSPEIDVTRVRRESKRAWAPGTTGEPVIFLDPWVWLEYLLGGEDGDAAERVIARAATEGEGGLIAPTVVTEVAYRVRVASDEPTAEEAVRAMDDLDGIECLPLVATVAEYAAELRYKYYDREDRAFSYADAIHLATATVHDGCTVLYSGDPDFEDVDEIETVVL